MSPENTTPVASPGDPPPTFEAALTRLEEIVARLERGEITLDESLEAFQEGSRLVRLCMDRINAAETAVQKLVRGEGGDLGLIPLDPGPGNRDED